MEEAKRLKAMSGGTSAVAFVDELYHFNSSQQNVLLPSVERGDLILIGTTTENPRYEINKTLLSRMIVFDLHPLEADDLLPLLRRALRDGERGLGGLELDASDAVLRSLALSSGGDVRQALTRLGWDRADGGARRTGRRERTHPLRPVGRRPLRHRLGPDQEHPGLGPRRRALLALPSAQGG